jgi:hypothetical protein
MRRPIGEQRVEVVLSTDVDGVTLLQTIYVYQFSYHVRARMERINKRLVFLIVLYLAVKAALCVRFLRVS